MSKNVILNGEVYNGVSEVELPVSGGTAMFRDVDEKLVEPLSITENGTYEAPEGVGGYSPVTVNVPTPINGIEYVTICPQFENRYPSSEPVIYCPLVSAWADLFKMSYGESYNYEHITIKSGKPATSLTCIAFLYNGTRGTKLKTITIDIPDLSLCTNYANLTHDNSKLSAVYGTPLDFSSVVSAANSNWLWHAGNNNIHVRYRANTLKVDHNLVGEDGATFDDDSIVSIANGLQSGEHTIKLSLTMQTKCQNIKGTVSQVTEGGASYDFFTKDESGDITLHDFITTTKGWTMI